MKFRKGMVGFFAFFRKKSIKPIKIKQNLSRFPGHNRAIKNHNLILPLEQKRTRVIIKSKIKSKSKGISSYSRAIFD